ncbi:MAG: putative rane protein [Anaerocolumna sp.]|jgi:hypothetical protein|nr:putative rane protein [Anaerocolumna sp.]
MNGLALKLIAIITMLIDHSTAVLVSYETSPNLYLLGRTIGRLAFPIFCFLLVEGLLHTKDVRKYLLRLGLFAILSEISFDLAFFHSNYYLQHQNIFFTLLIGLSVIFIMRKIEAARNGAETTYPFQVFSIVLEVIIVFAGCVAAYLLETDYSVFGVLQIVFFYVFRKKKIMLLLFVIFVNQMLGVVFGPPASMGEIVNILMQVVTSISIQSFATFAMILIFRYNGERGPKLNKYIFYAFYPVHLTILYLINTL